MIHVDRNRTIVSNPLRDHERLLYRIEMEKAELYHFYDRMPEERSQHRPKFNSRIWEHAEPALRELFSGNCAYCESTLGDWLDVDHFRPIANARGLNNDFARDHYWWLAYEWENLYPACQRCNSAKSTWFPVDGPRAPFKMPLNEIRETEKALLIDPCFDNPEQHLIFLETGQIKAISEKGKVTIEILRLDRDSLVRSRRHEIERFLHKVMLLYAQSGEDFLPYVNRTLGTESNESYLTAKRQLFRAFIERQMIMITSLAKDAGTDIKFLPLIGRTSTDLFPIGDALRKIRRVKLEKVALRNFKCFDGLEIDFDQFVSSPSAGAEPWLLFLGENGIGKSSILKAIAIALSGERYLKAIGLDPSDILKRGKRRGSIKMYLAGEEEPIEVNFDKNSIISSAKEPKANLIGYGSIRLLPKGKKITPETSNDGVKVKNLFDYSVALSDANEWLLQRKQKEFDRAALTLKDLMLLEPDDIIQRDPKNKSIFIRRKNTKIFISDLSDGFQSIYALAVDIMATLAYEGVAYEVSEGIVLIDEIGTHLHPRWKMEVVSQLRRAFPKIQFIVTTHEPLCLRGLRKGEVVVLAKNENKEIAAITDLPDPSELRIDQILTSDFFGLKSTMDPETEKLFEEYYGILALDEGDRSDEQKVRLLELSGELPQSKHLGDTLREDIAYYVIDELLAKKTRDEGLKMKEELRREAVERVEKLWNMISQRENKPL